MQQEWCPRIKVFSLNLLTPAHKSKKFDINCAISAAYIDKGVVKYKTFSSNKPKRDRVSIVQITNTTREKDHDLP